MLIYKAKWIYLFSEKWIIKAVEKANAYMICFNFLVALLGSAPVDQ